MITAFARDCDAELRERLAVVDLCLDGQGDDGDVARTRVVAPALDGRRRADIITSSSMASGLLGQRADCLGATATAATPTTLRPPGLRRPHDGDAPTSAAAGDTSRIQLAIRRRSQGMEGSAARATAGAQIATIPAARRAIGRGRREPFETFVRARAEDRVRPANVAKATRSRGSFAPIPRRFQP